MAFFDVQNLFRHAKDAFGHHHPNFDPLKLHARVCELKGWRPTLVRYYTGIPSAVEDPKWHGYWSNRILALKRAGVHVTTRPLRYRHLPPSKAGDTPQNIKIAQEKGIDLRLALDLVALARKRNFDVAVIYSQDQDLAEVVEEILEIGKEQERRIVLASAFPAGPRATSGRGIDRTEWIKITQNEYDACLDPRDFRPRGA
ncbi:NYN domain-containing protein [Alsobacter sp. SYSU M60028]|uniref:NYN domain-containing protein n=1 Tax=Alsobacter ponti TaxID=2962936 RepID=A0ABT1LBK9_9HYPH|nr:NYN domain-containing protein [Alsobacter ponti]MCP8938879.1 NYN domain-containing protein [Alsobacter ponti]